MQSLIYNLVAGLWFEYWMYIADKKPTVAHASLFLSEGALINLDLLFLCKHVKNISRCWFFKDGKFCRTAFDMDTGQA